MSTGDQTAYIRSKFAERGSMKTPKFMRDGFDAWAESSAPARDGGMEKEPAEMTGLGRDSIGEKYVGGTQMSMQGGVTAQDFISLVPKLFEWYEKVKSFTTVVKEDLRDPSMPVKYQPAAKTIANTLEMIGLGRPPHEALYESCMTHMSPRMGGSMHGGAGWQDWFNTVGKNLKSAYDWFLKNKPAIHFILKMKSINPPGKDYPAQLERAMTSVGLGRRHGGALVDDIRNNIEKFNAQQADMVASINKSVGKNAMIPKGGAMSAAQMQEAARRAMQEVKSRSEGVVRPQVSALVAKAAEVEARRAKNKKGGASCGCESEGSYGRPVGGRKPSARGAIVKQVMREQGLSLPQASKYVKENGLY